MEEKTIRRVLDAWKEFQKFGAHDGECDFGPPCPACNKPTGRCSHHAEAMTRRQCEMNDAIEALNQTINEDDK